MAPFLHVSHGRHSTAPITAVLPEDWLGSTPDGSVFDIIPYVSYAASDQHPGTHRKAQVRIAAAGSLLTAVASELVAGQMWAASETRKPGRTVPGHAPAVRSGSPTRRVNQRLSAR